MVVRQILHVLAVLVWACIAALPAAAYDTSILVNAEARATALQGELRQLTILPRNTSSNEAIQRDRTGLSDLRSKAKTELAKTDGPLAEVSKQLEELGPPPSDGQAEPQAIATKRAALNADVGHIQAVRKQFDLMIVEAEQAEARLTEAQREQFLQRLFTVESSILDPRMWWDVVANASSFVEIAVQRSRTALLISQSSWSWSSLLAVPLGLGLLWLVNNRILPMLFARIAGPAGPNERNSPLWRLWRAVWSGFRLFLMLLATYILLNEALTAGQFVPGILATLWEHASSAILSAILAGGVVYIICSPRRPENRLIAVGNKAAKTLPLIAAAASFFDDAGDGISQISSEFNMPVSFVVGQSAITALLLIILMALAFAIIRREAAKGLASGETPYFLIWIIRFMPLLWLLLIIAAMALVFGYVALSYFVASNLVTTLILIVVFGTLHALADAFSGAVASPSARTGMLFRRALGWTETAMARLALFIRTISDIVLTIMVAMILIGMWTDVLFDTSSIFTAVSEGFSIGNITISPLALGIAVGLFAIGVLLTRSITGWLERRVLADTHLDIGVKNSIESAATYAGYFLAAILALTASGVDFSNFAIVIGALGVGIGLGLQSIVNNFVSGLILLAERPVRVGDWVATNAGEGIVKKINVRSTEIETFDNCTIIVPNSNLISEAVRNWTHRDTVGRFTVSISVVHGSDAKMVSETLLKIAQDHPKVMRHPAPMVQLSRIAPLSLDFDLRGYTRHVFDAAAISSDLRMAVTEKLTKKLLLITPPAAPKK